MHAIAFLLPMALATCAPAVVDTPAEREPAPALPPCTTEVIYLPNPNATTDCDLDGSQRLDVWVTYDDAGFAQCDHMGGSIIWADPVSATAQCADVDY